MKVLVSIKRVIDPYVKIRVKSDLTGVETAQVKMSINPFDEIALEEAVRLKEQGLATEVVVVSIGDEGTQEALRQALALGADRAIHVMCTQSLDSLNVAKILKAVVQNEAPQLILMGKQSIDGDNNQTPQMLAGLLRWPQATYASKIKIEDNKAIVTREVDGGLQTISVGLPAVVSADLRLNEPRYASLPNIMKAKSKPINKISLEELGVKVMANTQTLRTEAPPVRSSGVFVDSVDALIEKLKHEAKVLG